MKKVYEFQMRSILIVAENPANELVRPLSGVPHYEEIREEDMMTIIPQTTITRDSQPTNSHMSNDTNDYLVPRTTIPQIYHHACTIGER